MAEPVIMPRQGLSVESCILTEWIKDVGDKVEKGDIIFSFETDKANFEKEAEVEGVLLEKFFQEGDEVPVLVNVAVVGREGEDTEPFRPDTSEEIPKEVQPGEEDEKQQGDELEETRAAEPPGKKGDEAILSGEKISPRAKNMAEKHSLDYRLARASGPGGRIIARDIETLLEEGPVFTPAAKKYYDDNNMFAEEGFTGTGPGGKITVDDLENAAREPLAEGPETEADYEEIVLSNVRKMIASAMHRSLQSMAQLTLNASFDARSILGYRKKIKANKERPGVPDATLTDMLLFTVSRTLKKHRRLNAHLVDEKLRVFEHVNLGVAVDTDIGLLVPTIFRADEKSLAAISSELKERVKECEKGSVNPDYFKGASFTVTNLGVLGVESFTPVINPPQTCILGVNSIVQRVKETEDGYEYYPAMGLSLTFDHRAIDGAPAARFLKDLKIDLENFELMLAT